MLRKIYIAVDCVDDAQKERIQKIAEEISGMRIFDGNMIEGVYPQLNAKKVEIYNIVKLLKEEGVRGLKSMKFLSLLSNMLR